MLQNYNNIISLTNKIHNLKLDKFPDNIILNENTDYKLVLKANSLSLVYIISQPSCLVTIPLINKPYTKFTIDWGDNIVSACQYPIISSNFTHTYITNTNELPKKYNILINGDFKGFNNISSIISTAYNYLYMINDTSTFISGDSKSGISGFNTYTTKYYLYAINNWGNVPIQDLTNFCINASGLAKIPNMPLPNVNHCMSAFMNCINLYKIFNTYAQSMQYFELPLNAVNCQDMFTNTNIDYNFINLNKPNYLTNIHNIFYNTKITGINSNFYQSFIKYYNLGSTYIEKISGNYYNAFPNTISATIISSEFDKDYFKNILSPH